MAANIDVTEGSGKTVATEDVGGTQFQIIKEADPTAGSTTPYGTVTNPKKSSPTAYTTGGCTPVSYLSAGATDEDSTVVKASAGQIYYIMVFNTVSSPRYFKLYNKATGPTSADTPTPGRFCVPANGGQGAGYLLPIPVGAAFTTGIAFRITTGIADNDTGAAAANDVLVNIGYK